MKNTKRDGGGGLQEWLSYQSRTREVVRPETDVIDWDEGIEVQEEWLPREACEQRLREEAERHLPLAPVSASAPETPVIELADVVLLELEAAALPAELPPAPPENVIAEPVAAPREIAPRAFSVDAALSSESITRSVVEPKSSALQMVGLDLGIGEVALPA